MARQLRLRGNCLLMLTALLLAGCMSQGERLLEACRYGRSDEARVLLERGASPVYKDKYGVTPLFLAVRKDDVSMVKQLLESGANPNEWGNGYDPLCEAAGKQTQIWQMLIAAGANVNAANSAGWTPLKSAIVARNVEFAGALISKGAAVNARDPGNISPLYMAVGSGPLTRLLVDAGANVKAGADKGGCTPLHCAGCPDAAGILIEAGADINAVWGQSTPLDSARGRLHEWKTYHERIHGLCRSKEEIEKSTLLCENVISVLEKQGAKSFKDLQPSGNKSE